VDQAAEYINPFDSRDRPGGRVGGLGRQERNVEVVASVGPGGVGLLTSTTTKEAPVDEYDGRQYVGIDLHRRRSVIVRMTPEGERLGGAVRIDNDPFELARLVASWGENPEVVLEATYGWYWAADVLAEAGANVHLAHPLGVKGFAYRRVKNDELDARDLADLLRMGRLPEAWVAPPEVRGLREEVRHRCKLVALRSGLKAQVHSVLAKQGVHVAVSDLFGVGGTCGVSKLCHAV
jgi:Transposase